MKTFLNTAIFFFLVFATFHAKAQLQVAYVDSPESVVNDVLLSKKSGVKLEMVKYLGSNAAIGTFSCNMVYNGFIDTGLILSTGNVMDAIGPNLNDGKSGKNIESGVGFLSQLAGSLKTYDAAVLAFDFVPSADSFCFKYIFASEEYPEYVNRGVNDVFAFVLIDLESGEKRNLAKLPDGVTPICIDEVNHLKNSQYFYLNGKWEPDNINKWRNDSIKGETALMMQFDGFTTILNAGARVEPGKKYRLILAISDVGDDVYDTAIFIEANSFKSKETNELKNLLNDLNTNIDGSFSGAKNLEFDFGSAEITNQKSLDFLDSLAHAIKKYKPTRIEIIGHTDAVGSEKENQLLSEARASFVKSYLSKNGLKSVQIICSGKGEQEPLNLEKPELNRRVEFRFFF